MPTLDTIKNAEKMRAALRDIVEKHPQRTTKELAVLMVAAGFERVNESWVRNNKEYAVTGVPKWKRDKLQGKKKSKTQQQLVMLPQKDSLQDIIKKLHACMIERQLRRVVVMDTGDVTVESVENFSI